MSANDSLRDLLINRPDLVRLEDLLDSIAGTDFAAAFGTFRRAKDLLRIDPAAFTRRGPDMRKFRSAAMLAALELARRIASPEPRRGRTFSKAAIARYLFARLAGEDREAYYLFTLSFDRRLIRWHLIARGGSSRVSVWYREILRYALIDSAAAIVVAHNHCDAPAWPSTVDRENFARLKPILRDVGIRAMDQLIVGTDGVFSESEDDLIFVPG